MFSDDALETICDDAREDILLCYKTNETMWDDVIQEINYYFMSIAIIMYVVSYVLFWCDHVLDVFWCDHVLK